MLVGCPYLHKKIRNGRFSAKYCDFQNTFHNLKKILKDSHCKTDAECFDPVRKNTTLLKFLQGDTVGVSASFFCNFY